MTSVPCNHPNWTHDVQEKQLGDAQTFLSLYGDKDAETYGKDFQDNADDICHYRANDILRAAKLPLQPVNDPDVTRHIAEMKGGQKLHPVLLVRGKLGKRPLVIADGYHRVCAGFYDDPNQDIPCVAIDA